MIRALPARFVEHIHDVLVSILLPFDEQVNPAEYRSKALIESAVGRPHQTAFGEEVWPSLSQKAAAMFHSLACNHCFINGNKRTAVIALDMFLTVNHHLLVMTSEEIYEMARETAKANEDDRDVEGLMVRLEAQISASLVDMQMFNDADFQNRLGDRYEKVMAQLQRIVNLTTQVWVSIKPLLPPGTPDPWDKTTAG